jgi:hypothetical protein
MRINSCYRFLFKKYCFRGFFNQKVRVSICLWWCFVYSGWLGVIYDSQATNRSALGRGFSQLVLPAFSWSPGSHFLLLAARLRTFLQPSRLGLRWCPAKTEVGQKYVQNLPRTVFFIICHHFVFNIFLFSLSTAKFIGDFCNMGEEPKNVSSLCLFVHICYICSANTVDAGMFF